MVRNRKDEVGGRIIEQFVAAADVIEEAAKSEQSEHGNDIG